MRQKLSTYEKHRVLEELLKTPSKLVLDEILLPLADDPDEEVRWLVAEIMVRRKHTVAFPYVLRLLQSAKKESPKLRGLNLLDLLNHAPAAMVIVDYLKNGNFRVRRSAAMTLMSLGSEAIHCLENKWASFNHEEKLDILKAFDGIPGKPAFLAI